MWFVVSVAVLTTLPEGGGIVTETVVRAEAEPGIDEELLAEAQRGLGTSSRNATLNAALREYVEAKRERRRKAYDNVQRMAADGEIDFEAIAEADR